VRLHSVVGKLELDPVVAGAAFLALFQSQLARVRHKAAVPCIDAFRLLALFRGRIFVMNLVRATTEEIRFAIVAIAKGVIVIEDEIQIVKEIDHHRRVCHYEKTRGCTATIEVLTPDVQRRSQYTAGFPTNRLLAPAAGIPDQAFAFASENVKHFFEQIALLLCLRAWRKFAK